LKVLATGHTKKHVSSIPIRIRITPLHHQPEVVDQNDFVEEGIRPFLFAAMLRRGWTHAQFTTITSDLAQSGTEVVLLIEVKCPKVSCVLLAAVRKSNFNLSVLTTNELG